MSRLRRLTSGPLKGWVLYYVRGLVWLTILGVFVRAAAAVWDAGSLRPAVGWALSSPERLALGIGVAIVLPLDGWLADSSARSFRGTAASEV